MAEGSYSSRVPALAHIANAQTPYRLHFLRRVVREIPGVKLWSAFLQPVGIDSWTAVSDEIAPVALAQDVPPVSAWGRLLYDWRVGGRVIRWLKSRPDVRAAILLGYSDPGRLRIIAWCRRNGMPLFVWGDGNIRSDRPGKLKGFIKRLVVPRILRRTTGALCCGRLGREFFRRYGVPDARIFVMTNEPDYELITSLSPEFVEQTARRFGLEAGRRRIVFSGRLVPAKRVDLLIDAFAAIAAHRPEWDLLIVGGGELHDALKARVPASLAGRVLWTGYLNDQPAVSALYQRCDVLALPSDYEPWALVVNEATRAGLALVCSDVVGAAAELLRDGVNGRLFPAGDVKALEEALLDVTDPAKIDSMKAASPPLLQEWRRVGDPVQGVRDVLRYVGILENPATPGGV